jgi:hypothetical protein
VRDDACIGGGVTCGFLWSERAAVLGVVCFSPRPVGQFFAAFCLIRFAGVPGGGQQ